MSNSVSLLAKAKLPCLPGFEIQDVLGKGGMGIVYKAVDLESNRLVAIKLFSGLEEEDCQRRFQRESEAALKLSHPNIVRVLKANSFAGANYLVMELVDGIDLSRLLKEAGPLPIWLATNFLRQAANGLQHAFENGLVHRDIKPANLMVTPVPKIPYEETGHAFGTIKIMDFGLARIFDTEDHSVSRLTMDNLIMGTPDYIAPEQTEDSHEVDIRADLYSLGCTFYHLLTGQVPFPGSSTFEKIDRHRWSRPRPIQLLRRDVPRPLADIFRKLLAKHPNDRFQTPADLAAALDALQADSDTIEDLSVPTQTTCAISRIENDLSQRIESMQNQLAELIEQDRIDEAEGLADAILQVRPNISAVVAAKQFLRMQKNRLLPVGECYRFEVEGNGVAAVAVSPDGKHLAAASNDRIWVWNLDRRELRQRIDGHTSPINALAFHVDGDQILSTSQAGRLMVHTLDGRLISRQRIREVQAIALHRDGESIFTANADGSVRQILLRDGSRLRRFDGHEKRVTSLAVSADGRWLLSGSWDHTVRLWDIDKCGEVHRFESSLTFFEDVALSGDGKTAVAVGTDYLLHVWDLTTGQRRQPLEGHGNRIAAVALSRDGQRAVTAGADATVRLWDLASGVPLYLFSGHTDAVTCVAFSPDNDFAFSGSADGTVRCWKLIESFPAENS
ncbi:MAG: hypothetical protein KatS3mg105_4123 [Gemmatales bacterium]|nr:MAG: hypothetical protein KatS3mg105_4123 [Gemmatales bacterium]